MLYNFLYQLKKIFLNADGYDAWRSTTSIKDCSLGYIKSFENIPNNMLKEIIARYELNGNPYHNFGHVHDMLIKYSITSLWSDRIWGKREIFWAILFHDIVYDPKRKDNEQKSADLAVKMINKYLPNHGLDLDWIYRTILLTSKHGSINESEIDDDQKLVLDLDMSIFSGDFDDVLDYDLAIRREYKFVPLPLYKEKRLEFLKSLLALDSIYFCYYMETENNLAKQNIQMLINQSWYHTYTND